MVTKPHSKKLHLVIEYHRYNSQTVQDSYSLPHINYVLYLVGKYHCFAKLNLKSAFWDICLDEGSRANSGFITPDGLF